MAAATPGVTSVNGSLPISQDQDVVQSRQCEKEPTLAPYLTPSVRLLPEGNPRLQAIFKNIQTSAQRTRPMLHEPDGLPRLAGTKGSLALGRQMNKMNTFTCENLKQLAVLAQSADADWELEAAELAQAGMIDDGKDDNPFAQAVRASVMPGALPTRAVVGALRASAPQLFAFNDPSDKDGSKAREAYARYLEEQQAPPPAPAAPAEDLPARPGSAPLSQWGFNEHSSPGAAAQAPGVRPGSAPSTPTRMHGQRWTHPQQPEGALTMTAALGGGSQTQLMMPVSVAPVGFDLNSPGVASGVAAGSPTPTRHLMPMPILEGQPGLDSSAGAGAAGALPGYPLMRPMLMLPPKPQTGSATGPAAGVPSGGIGVGSAMMRLPMRGQDVEDRDTDRDTERDTDGIGLPPPSTYQPRPIASKPNGHPRSREDASQSRSFLDYLLSVGNCCYTLGCYFVESVRALVHRARRFVGI